LAGLSQAGYEFVSMADYIKSSENNSSLTITFDDGYDSFYDYAFPILTELKIPAIVFIPFKFIGKKATWDYGGRFRQVKHLSEDQIKEISTSGIDIGSHGLTHIDLSGLSERMLKLELERPKKGLEDLTGKEVRYLSYPFGRYNGNVEAMAAELGYERGFSLSYYKKSHYGFTYPRFAVYTFDTPYSVGKKLRHGLGNHLERIKGAVMNSYAYGTILLNKLKSTQRPEYH